MAQHGRLEIAVDDFLDAERRRDRREDEVGVPDRGQRYPVRSVGEGGRDVRGGLQRQACLPGSARSGQGHQPRVRAEDQLRDGRELLDPADESRRRYRQVRAVERSQGRERRIAKLVDAFRCRQILQPMLPEVSEVVALDERSSRGRHQHLATVSRRRDPGDAMEVRADVSLVGQDRSSGMDADADPDRSQCEPSDGFARRRKGAGRARKGKKKGIPLCVDLDPAVARTCLADQPSVVGQRRAVCFLAELQQEPGRPLDVGRDQRDGSRREGAPCHRAKTTSERGPTTTPVAKVASRAAGRRSSADDHPSTDAWAITLGERGTARRPAARRRGAARAA